MQPGSVALMTPQSADGDSAREAVASLVGQETYDHWFRDKTQLLFDGDELVVRAGSPFLAKWLEKQFRDAAVEAAKRLIGPAARVRFEVATGAPELIPPPALLAPKPGAAPLRAPPADGSPAKAIGGASAALPVSAPVRASGRRFADLADFVAGPCNELALTAVRQFCGQLDGAGGPLFLYGPVGTGKSHLLEGIHKHLRRTRAELQVVFLTSEQFTNYFTQAYREHTLPAFRQRFRTVDVLLVDDVDFLDGKRVIQEEFLHTFKQLESFGKPVAVCADRHPRLLAKTSDELRTRFLSGMVCRLDAPDLETRERIVFRRAEKFPGEFSPEALRYVAQRFTGSVRELEGALNCLQVYRSMTGKRVGVTAARQVLSDLERDCLRVVRLADIERAVCDFFGLQSDDLRSARRTRSVSEPRMLAMYLARRHTRSAYSEIGQHFGGRNHATVIAAERRVADWLTRDVPLRVASRPWPLGDILRTLEQQLLAG